MRPAPAVVLAALLMAGCAVGPNYERPPLTTPVQFRVVPGDLPPAPADQAAPADAAPPGEEVATGPAASIADGGWWTVFNDPALADLINEALTHGYDARLAAWRVEEARAQAGIAQAEYFPAIQGGAGWTRGRESDFITPVPGTNEFYQVNLGLSWEVDVWGRIRRLNEAALARYLSTEEARRGVWLSLVSDVANRYFELRALDLELDIARRTAASFEETHGLFSRRQATGIASALETASAAAPLASTRAAIPELERRIVETENRIALLLGRNPGEVPRGAALDDQILPPEIPAGLPSDLLKRRPDLRQAEEDLVAANAEVGVAVANFFPSISLTAAFGGVAPKVAQLFGDGKSWSVGGGLLTPIFQGRRLHNEHRAALARFEQAKIAYERSVTNAFGEVSTALTAYQRLAEVERRQAEAVTAYREAVRLANERYLSGLSDYLEVLLAQRQLFPAETSLAEIRVQRLEVLTGLYRALGGGWNLEDGAWKMAEARHE
jgi:multidrug efflux system outer membrane protein